MLHNYLAYNKLSGPCIAYLVGSDVVDKVVGPAVVAVHGAQVPPDKVPLLVSVPRHVLVLEHPGKHLHTQQKLKQPWLVQEKYLAIVLKKELSESK